MPWHKVQTAWDSFSRLIGRQNETLLTMYGLHTVRQNKARWRNRTDWDTMALVLALVVGVAVAWYLRGLTPVAPQHGSVPYRPLPPPVTERKEPPGVALYTYTEPLPEVTVHGPLRTETRLVLRPLTSGTFQIGPRDPAAVAWRVCTSATPGNDTDFVTANVVSDADATSKWRLLGTGDQGVYFLQGLANAWYLSAHTWKKEGEERVRVQSQPLGDERLLVDGTPDSFRISSRKWGEPRYLAINPAMSHFLFLPEGSNFRAFRS